MGETKRIVFLASASNFERQQNMVKALHHTLKTLGGYTLTVITVYDAFITDDYEYGEGKSSVYKLIEKSKFDGAIIDAVIGSTKLIKAIIDRLHKLKIPVVTLGIKFDKDPCVTVDYSEGCRELMEYLMQECNCYKINFVMTFQDKYLSKIALEAYSDIMKKQRLPIEKNRIIDQKISIYSGRDIVNEFEKKGVLDCQAVVTLHDISAIAVIEELENRGIQVPDDVKVVSLNCGNNSYLYKPDIMGVGRMDMSIAKQACTILIDLMDGKKGVKDGIIKGAVKYGYSGGRRNVTLDDNREIFRQVVVSKVEMGTQIGHLIDFEETVKKMETIEDFEEALKIMLSGIYCRNFYCNVNLSAFNEIATGKKTEVFSTNSAFDDECICLLYEGEHGEFVKNTMFKTENLIPTEMKEDGVLIIYQLYSSGKTFGYMAFLNDTFTIDMYDYRIIQSSIAAALEKLRNMALDGKKL